MEVDRSVSRPSSTGKESGAYGQTAFRQVVAPRAPFMRRPACAQPHAPGVRVTISQEGSARASKNAVPVTVESDDSVPPDLMCWLIAISLGIIMGWSAAGNL